MWVELFHLPNMAIRSIVNPALTSLWAPVALIECPDIDDTSGMSFALHSDTAVYPHTTVLPLRQGSGPSGKYTAVHAQPHVRTGPSCSLQCSGLRNRISCHAGKLRLYLQGRQLHLAEQPCTPYRYRVLGAHNGLVLVGTRPDRWFQNRCSLWWARATLTTSSNVHQ